MLLVSTYTQVSTELRMTLGMFMTHLHPNEQNGLCLDLTNQKPKQYRQT